MNVSAAFFFFRNYRRFLMAARSAWFLEQSRSWTSFLYLIDTGLREGDNIIFKYGRSTNLQARVKQHARWWPHLRIVHVERVFDSVTCEKKFRSVFNDKLWLRPYVRCGELVTAPSPRIFTDGMVSIAEEERKKIKSSLDTSFAPNHGVPVYNRDPYMLRSKKFDACEEMPGSFPTAVSPYF
jgi:hypothetical protein